MCNRQYGRRLRWWPAAVLLLIVVALGATVVLASSHNGSRVLLPDPRHYSATPYFTLSGTFPVQPESREMIGRLYPDLPLWGSWSGSDENVSQLVTPIFVAPAHLTLYTAGYPSKLKNHIWAVHVETGERLELVAEDSAEAWISNTWSLPSKWVGDQVRLLVTDGETETRGWLGVSAPISRTWISVAREEVKVLGILPLYAVSVTIFLLPGIAFLLSWQGLRRWFHSALFIPLAVLGSSLIGYLTFWAYFFNHRAGVTTSILVVMVSGVLVARLLRRPEARSLLLSRDIAVPSILMFAIGLLYLGVLYISHIPSAPDTVVQSRFIPGLPIDTLIPRLFADKLFVGEDARALFGDWLSSDRPPLQTGIVLIQRPFASWLGSHAVALQYQLVATAAQCVWVPAVWGLCRVLRATVRQTAVVFAFAIMSGFFLLNSLYVWPKLLAGSLVVLAVAFLVDSPSRGGTHLTHVTTASLAVALGVLAHAGVAFFFPGLMIVLLTRPGFPSFKLVLAGFVTFTVLLLPWVLYQKVYEPPGNRLAKWHLAGVIEIDDRSTVQALTDSYMSVNFERVIANKTANLRMLFTGPPALDGSLEALKQRDWRYTFTSLGFLNAGWLPILFRRWRHSRHIAWSHTRLLLGSCLVSLGFWVLAMFGPATTVIHQGSYATMIALFVGLGLSVSTLPRSVIFILTAANGVWFAYTWLQPTSLATTDSIRAGPNSFAVALIIGSALLITAALFRAMHLLKLDSPGVAVVV